MNKFARHIALTLLALLMPAWAAAASLDGSVTGSFSSGTSITTSSALTCGSAGDVIVVFAFGVAEDITSVTGTGATFTLRESTGLPRFELWTGYAAGTFNSTITVNFGAGPFAGGVHAFCVNGPPSSSYFDTDAGLPVEAHGFSPGDGDPLSIDTDTSDTFIISGFRSDAADSAAGSGWTKIAQAGEILTQYRIVSSPQTALTVDIGAPMAGNTGAGIADALVFTPSSAPLLKILQMSSLTPVNEDIYSIPPLLARSR